MANRWIEFVRMWARKNNISYACAVSRPECKEEYRTKYGNRKKLPQKKERELMGMEDINILKISPEPEKKKKKKKSKMMIDDEVDILVPEPESKKKKKKVIKLVDDVIEDLIPEEQPSSKKKSTKKGKSGETVEDVFMHLVKEFKETINDADVLSVAQERIRTGFTIEDEKEIRKLSKEILRKQFAPFGGVFDTYSGRYYTTETAPKNVIIDNLFGIGSVLQLNIDEGEFPPFEEWKKQLEIVKSSNKSAPKELIKKTKGKPIVFNPLIKQQIETGLKRYFYRYQLLDLARYLGVGQDKSDTKIHTIPMIIDKIEKGELSFNDIVKYIREGQKSKVTFKTPNDFGMLGPVSKKFIDEKGNVNDNTDYHDYFVKLNEGIVKKTID